MVFFKGLLIGGILSLAIIVEAIPVKRQAGGKKNDCVPAFLASASEDVRKQFKAIDDQSLNWTERSAQFDALAAKQTPEIQAAYQKYKTEFKTKYDALSSDAKSALEALGAIKEDDSLNSDEKEEQEKSEWMKLSKDVQSKIIDMLQLQGDCGGMGADSTQ